MADTRTIQVSTYVSPPLAELVDTACRINGESKSAYLYRLIKDDLLRQGWVEQPAIQWNTQLFKAS